MNNDSGETVEGTNYFSCRHSQQQRETALTNYFSGENVLQDRKVNYRFTFAMQVATFLVTSLGTLILDLSSLPFFSFLFERTNSTKKIIRTFASKLFPFTRRVFFRFEPKDSCLPQR